MTTPTQTQPTVEEQLEDVLLSYLQAVDAGQAPTPAEVVAQHPHLAEQLKAAFADEAFLSSAIRPIADPAPPSPETLPQSFGDYELRERIGRGGMGVVYRAHQRSLNRIVALKRMRDAQEASPEDVARFRREAESMANLEHANIVPIYEVGDRDGRVFFSMKLVEGGSLDQHVKTYINRPRAAARLLTLVARAVHYAHQRGILHRDLKPANILLDSAPATSAAPAKTASEKKDAPKELEAVHPFVTDFGLACRIDEAAAQSSQGTVVGTAAYMAPEQAAGAKGISTAADVYGLGAVLYEMLTGRPPFQGKDVLDTLRMVRETEPAPPRSINRQVNRDLEAVCLKCLQKDPAKRYGSAEKLAEDLQRYLHCEPTRARPAGRLRRIALWARRRPGIAALTFAIVIVALLGVVGVVWMWTEAEANLRKELAQDYVNRINLAQNYVNAGQPYLAEEQLDACPPALQAWEWYYLKRLCHRDRPELIGHFGPVLAVSYSRDGALLATGGSQDGKAKIWDAKTGALLHTLGDHPEGVKAVWFSECPWRGMRVVTACEDQTVRVWDAAIDKKPPVQTLTGAGDMVAASRDGQRIAAVGRQKVVTVWDAAQGTFPDRPTHQESLDMTVNGIALSPDGDRLAVWGYGGLLQVWNIAKPSWTPVRLPKKDEWIAKDVNVWAAAFSADGRKLAVGGRQPIVWDLVDLESSPRLFSEPGDQRCNALAFSPNGNLLVGIYQDGLVRVWETKWGAIVTTAGKAEGHNQAAAFSPDGSRLALTWHDEVIVEPIDPRWRDRSNDEPDDPTLLVDCNQISVWTLAFSRDGRLAFRVGDEVVLADPLVRPVAPTRVKVGEHIADGANLAFGGSDGRLLLSGRPGAALWVWDAAAQAPGSAVIPAADVRCLAVSEDGRLLATTSGTNGVELRDLPGGGLRASFGGGGDVKALAFRPGRSQLASCGGDGRIHLWDLTTGKELRTFDFSRDSPKTKVVMAVAFSSDGSRMAAAGTGLTVHVWDPDDGRDVCPPMTGHYGCVNGVAFSPDGRRLASCAADGTVKLWDPASGQEVLTLPAQNGPVQAVAFGGPDGRLLAACSRDGTVRIWDGRPAPYGPSAKFSQ